MNKPFMEEKMTVIQATTEHYNVISRLGKETFAETFGHLFQPAVLDNYLNTTFHPEKIKSSIGKEGNRFFIASCNNEPVGYAKIKENSSNPAIRAPRQAQLQKIYLLSQWHGKGIGSLLMNVCIDHLKLRAPVTVWLDVLETNAKAIRFYHKFGFEKAGKDQYTFENASFTYDVLRLDIS